MPGNYSKLVTVITGQTITAAERNNEFDNVINNMTPDGVDDASVNTAAMQATADPSGGSLATDLRGELKRLRFQILKLGSASGNWYDALPFLGGITPATPGATATDLNNRLAQIVKHLQTLNVASGNWYDVMSFLAGITPAAAGATGTDLTNRLAQIASQIKNLGGLTNWYDAVTAALLKAGGTMAGAIAMGANKITGLAAATAAGDALRYEQNIVIQTVQGTTVTSASTSSATFQDTNLAAAITCRNSSSRVKISVHGDIQNGGTAGNNAYITIKRSIGSVNIGNGNSGLNDCLTQVASTTRYPISCVIIDSPATASAITYTVQIRSSDGATTVTFPSGNTPLCAIILEEIV